MTGELGWLNNHEAGSGPYMLGNYQPGVSLTIDRFSGYWLGWSSNPHPYNTVTYTIVTSDATVLSLAKEGSLDWVSDYLQTLDIPVSTHAFRLAIHELYDRDLLHDQDEYSEGPAE